MLDLADYIDQKYKTYTNPVFYNDISDTVVDMIIGDIDFDTVPGRTLKQFEKALSNGPLKDLRNTILDYLTFCVSYEPQFTEIVDRIKTKAVSEYCNRNACPDTIQKWVGDPTKLVNKYNLIRSIESMVWEEALANF